MKLSRQKIGYIVFLLCLLVFNKGLYLIPFKLDRFNIIVLLIFIGIFVCCKDMSFPRGAPEYRAIFYFLVMYLLQILISSVRYNQSLIDSFFAGKAYISILLFILLAKGVGTTENSLKKCERMIEFLSMLASILLVIQVLILHNTGIEILQGITYGKRADSVRVLAMAHLVDIGILLSSAELMAPNEQKISKLWRMINIINIVTGFISLFFVSQTRMSMVVVATAMGVIFISKDIDGTREAFFRRIASVILVIVALYLFLNSDVYKALMYEFNRQTVSVDNRVSAVSYYVEQLCSSPIKFVFGRGMVHDQNINFLSSITGPGENLSRSDVGILGFADEFGLLGVIWYFWIITFTWRTIRDLRKKKIVQLDFEVYWLYLVLSSFTLFIMNDSRIISFPIILFISLTYRQKRNVLYNLE